MSLSEMSSGTAADSQGPPSPHLLQARLDDAMLMGKLVLFLREWEFGFRAQMPGCVLASFLSLSLSTSFISLLLLMHMSIPRARLLLFSLLSQIAEGHCVHTGCHMHCSAHWHQV